MEDQAPQINYATPGECEPVAGANDPGTNLRMQCLQLAMANRPHLDSYSTLSDARDFLKFILS